MGPILAAALATLASVFTAKEAGDLIAKFKGMSGLAEWAGAEPSREQIAELAIAQKRGKAKGASRMAQMEEVNALKDRVESGEQAEQG